MTRTDGSVVVRQDSGTRHMNGLSTIMGLVRTEEEGLKAISLHEPWASLIASGHKTLETRSWRSDWLAAPSQSTQQNEGGPSRAPRVDPIPKGYQLRSGRRGLTTTTPFGKVTSYHTGRWS